MALPRSVVMDNFQDPTDYFHELDLMAGGEASAVYVRKERHLSGENERQIMVDPISLQGPPEATGRKGMPAPAKASEKLPPLPQSFRPRAISHSLPSSACSSPRLSFQALRRKSSKKPQFVGHPHGIDSFGRFSVQQQARLLRSKSCGEKRWCAPSDELDLLFGQPTCSTDTQTPQMSCRLPSTKSNGKRGKKKDADVEEGFKCGVLCMHLSRFGKSKPVNSCRKEIVEVEADIGSIISRTVSLERFECGSWASSAFIADLVDQDGEDRRSLNLFFDLPLELIRIGLNDTTAPVSSAFLFDDKDCNDSAKLHERYTSPSHHFALTPSSNFSLPASPTAALSSPYKLTPDMRHGRADFDALLQAHNA